MDMTLSEAQELVERGYRVLVTFRAICRWPTRKSTRIIRKFNIVGQPVVRFEGCADFVLRRSEIIRLGLRS